MADLINARVNEPFKGSLRPYLQPVIVALVCLVLICLFLVMGFMNLRALDRTLADLTKNSGLAILRNVQQVADNYYRQLTFAADIGYLPDTTNPLSGTEQDAPVLFSLELTELVREIDLEWKASLPNNSDLLSFMQKQNLRIVAFIDNHGNNLYSNQPLSEEVKALIAPVLSGQSELKIDLFNTYQKPDDLGYIALRRKSGNGAILIGLDETGFRARSLIFSLIKAIQEIGLNDDASYFLFKDYRSRLIGLEGDLLKARIEAIGETVFFDDTPDLDPKKITLNGQTIMEIKAPVSFNNRFEGILGLGLKTEASQKIMQRNRNNIILSTGFMIVIAFFSIWFLYMNQNRYLKWIQAIERRMNRIERLSALGRLAAGVAHEIRNPLNAISMAVQRLHREKPDKLTGVIRDEIQRLNLIIEDFLSVSRTRKLVFKPENINELLKQMLLLLEEETQSKGIKIQTGLKDPDPIFAMDREKMKQALLNIINNALESIEDKGSLVISTKTAGKDKVIILIKDSGKGLSPEDLEHIFDPDYTTKDKGLGLGLPIAHEIILGHGGEIRVQSTPGKGSTFEIVLPLYVATV